MANLEQLEILKQGVEVWNKWREENPDMMVDLSNADLSGANLDRVDLSAVDPFPVDSRKVNLSRANLSGTNLSHANLSGADLRKANLTGADLTETIFNYADLSEADFRKTKFSATIFYSANLNKADLSDVVLDATFHMADLQQANLSKIIAYGTYFVEANLSESDLSESILIGAKLWNANLSGANLTGAALVEVNLNGANLSGAKIIKANLRGAQLIGATVENAVITGSYVFGVNVWDLKGEFREQKDLSISSFPNPKSSITVDNIKVAQFICLILNNEEIRDIINTLTSKTVLILGRFSIPERKAILDALRNKLREYNLLPIVFDFDRPTDKDFTETIKTLAGLSYFVIADVTNPKSSPLELQATVPDYQIPFVPIIQEGEYPFAMMVDLQKKYNWVLKTITYNSVDTLMKILKPLIIDPAMKKRQELRLIKAQEPEVISGKDFLEKGKV